MKKLGQVFTPNFIVEKMLTLSNFDNVCFDIKILEPSFGEGVFLLHIIEKIIQNGKNKGLTKTQIISVLENNIYGVEIDEKLFNKTIDNISQLLLKYDIDEIKLHLYNQDFLDFDPGMNFNLIIGNPPYIRVHDMDKPTREKIKKFEFSTGTTDLYIIFFEKCIKLLDECGILTFITPNSFIRNSSQKTFRKFLTKNKYIKEIIDFESTKIFDNVDTYTAITVLQNNNTDNTFIYKKTDKTTIKSEINIDFTQDDWFKIKTSGKTLGDICNAQYGFATNADDIFISDHLFDGEELEDDILRDIVKGSRIDTCKTQKIIFPYKKEKDKYIPLTEQEFKDNYPKAYNYLLNHKTELLDRSLQSNTNWFEFARTQSIQQVDKEKLVIKHIIDTESKTVTYKKIPAGVCVYSGVYITGDNLDEIAEIIKTEEFCEFVKNNGKDMSGGYKNFNTKTIKQFEIK